MILSMTQRVRLVIALFTATAALTSAAVAAVPAPAPKVLQEVITIERTAKTGLSALALIGKIKAERSPGFFAIVDRDRYGARLQTMADFGGPTGITRFGHGSSTSLCNAPFVCAFDQEDGSLRFSITETDDADSGSAWAGVTRYLVIRGTKIDLQVAAIGFTVKRHTTATFAQVTREAADADGVEALGIGTEVFRAAQLRGGARGSFAALQLPCDVAGAGGTTFTATGDSLPQLVYCEPSQRTPFVYVSGSGGTAFGVETYERAGLFSRSAAGPVQWQVNGLVTGVSMSPTRLFVLNY